MSTKQRTIAELPIGYQLGKFEIVLPVARDGQALVYLARVSQSESLPVEQLARRLRLGAVAPATVQNHKLCIVKIAAPGWEDSLRDEHKFLSQSQVRHRRVIALYQLPDEITTGRRREPRGLWFAKLRDSNGELTDNLPYIALEYLPGGSLKDVLERRNRRPLPAPVAVSIARQICEAIEHLHSQAGIIHHDISPSNIVFRTPLPALLPAPLDCVLIDLAAADTPGKPRRTQIYGRKTYLPPERLQDRPGAHGPLVDVYGLGVVLYEMLVGRLPRTGTDAIHNMPLPLPPIRERAPHISDSLAALVDAAVDHDPGQRPNVRQLAAALERTPEARGNTAMRSGNMRRLIAPIVGGTLTLLLALGGLIFMLAGSLPSAAPTPTPLPVPTLTPISSPTLLPTLTLPPPTSTPVSSTPVSFATPANNRSPRF